MSTELLHRHDEAKYPIPHEHAGGHMKHEHDSQGIALFVTTGGDQITLTPSKVEEATSPRKKRPGASADPRASRSVS